MKLKKKKEDNTETHDVVVSTQNNIPAGEVLSSLNSEKEIDQYIESHRNWWHIGKLQEFINRIPHLVNDKKLRLYFSLAIGKLRNQLKTQQTLEAVYSAKHKRPYRDEPNDIEPGDIYGPPRFYRYGEGGHGKKKSYSKGFTYKNDEY